ncbi:MAG: hypothetical protein QM773_17135 [Hyphomonadaceae bacterium]
MRVERSSRESLGAAGAMLGGNAVGHVDDRASEIAIVGAADHLEILARGAPRALEGHVDLPLHACAFDRVLDAAAVIVGNHGGELV